MSTDSQLTAAQTAILSWAIARAYSSLLWLRPVTKFLDIFSYLLQGNVTSAEVLWDDFSTSGINNQNDPFVAYTGKKNPSVTDASRSHWSHSIENCTSHSCAEFRPNRSSFRGWWWCMMMMMDRPRPMRENCKDRPIYNIGVNCEAYGFAVDNGLYSLYSLVNHVPRASTFVVRF